MTGRKQEEGLLGGSREYFIGQMTFFLLLLAQHFRNKNKNTICNSAQHRFKRVKTILTTLQSKDLQIVVLNFKMDVS